MANSTIQNDCYPLTDEGSVDLEKVKELYFKSSLIAWKDFASEMGWPKSSFNKFPTTKWKIEKKQKFAEKKYDEIKELSVEHAPTWSIDVVNTITNYPKTAEAFHALIKTEVNRLLAQSQSGKKLKVSELVSLSNAFARIQETKYKSLLISEMTKAHLERDAKIVGSNGSDSGQSNIRNVGIIGFKDKPTDKDIQKLMAQFLDQPVKPIEEMDMVDVNPPEPLDAD